MFLLAIIIFSPFSRSKKILLCGAVLLLFGILAVYSVSTFESFNITRSISGLELSNYFYFKKHIRSLIVSIIIAIIIYKLPLRIFTEKKYITILFIGAVLLQALVFVPGLQLPLKGANGWIYIPKFSTIQPSEIFKIAYVLFMTSRFIRKKHDMKDPKFISSFIFINIILLGVFMFIPDFGTALILGLVSMIMVRYIGLDEKRIATIIGVGTVGFFLLLGVLSLLSGGEKTESITTSDGKTSEITVRTSNKYNYLFNRLSGFFGKKTDEGKRGIRYQNHQAKLAIGGGGFWGQGYGKGLQKFGYIPEAQSDFIFAAYSEEIGFFGNITLLGVYFILMYYFLIRLKQNKDEYARLLGVGLISTIIIQMFVNVGVNLEILPNTGITLPFISHGGTALMANVIQLILIYKITYQNEFGYLKK